MKSVTIQSQSSPTGYRDFIGVGTSINKGEDISVRGAVSAPAGDDDLAYIDDHM